MRKCARRRYSDNPVCRYRPLLSLSDHIHSTTAECSSSWTAVLIADEYELRLRFLEQSQEVLTAVCRSRDRPTPTDVLRERGTLRPSPPQPLAAHRTLLRQMQMVRDSFSLSLWCRIIGAPITSGSEQLPHDRENAERPTWPTISSFSHLRPFSTSNSLDSRKPSTSTGVLEVSCDSFTVVSRLP